MRLRIATAMLFVSFAVLLMPPLLARDRITLPTADSSDVAAVAAQTLANSGSKEAIPVLRRMLNHPSIVVRYYAAYGLGKLGDKESIKALQDSLWLKENDTPEDMLAPSIREDLGGDRRLVYAYGGFRQMACWALRKLGDTSASVDKRFIEILEDQTPVPKEFEKRIKELIQQLGADKWERREAAHNALLEIGDPAFKQMEEAAKSADAEIASRASELLKELEPAHMKRRMEAYRCLEQLGTEAAFNAMCKVAGDDRVDFGAAIPWIVTKDTALTEEQMLKLYQLAALNKNLPEDVRKRHQSYVDSVTLGARLKAAKSAEDLKTMFLQEKDPGRLYVYRYYFREHDLGDVEGWMDGYIADWYGKNKKHERYTVSDTMLEVLWEKGTQRSLPMLEMLMKDEELSMDVRAKAIQTLHEIGRRCMPDANYLVIDRGGIGNILKKEPEDRAILLEGYKSSRDEITKRILERLRRPVSEPNSQEPWDLRKMYIDTLLAWKSSELVDIAVEWLEKDKTPEDASNDFFHVNEACAILRTMDAKGKLPELKKFYERTHWDYLCEVTGTMYALGDKDVPKMILAEAKALEPGKKVPYYSDPYIRLLMYDDVEGQKFFFDMLMKETPDLEQSLLEALYTQFMGGSKQEYVVNMQLALPAIEKILKDSKRNYRRVTLIQSLAKCAEKEPEIVKVLQRFAAHSMDICEQARKLIPQLGDKDFDVRKKTREELQKLGIDAVPAFEEWQKYADPEIQQALKELAESYKDYNTGY